MPICPNCEHENREGVVYCETCGERLPSSKGDITLPTRPVEIALEEFFARVKHSVMPIGDECLFVFDAANASESVFIPYARPATIGRRDTSGPLKADIDLTKYGAFEHGVSRIHAALYRTDDTLSIFDLTSRNGTFLNGQRLKPRVPYVLRNGDEVWFAKLAVHIYFKEPEFVR